MQILRSALLINLLDVVRNRNLGCFADFQFQVMIEVFVFEGSYVEGLAWYHACSEYLGGWVCEVETYHC